MVTNLAVLLIVVTLTSVTCQTFQYSRGWTNGKRAGHRSDDVREISGNIQRMLGPCQLSKLKYVLEGNPWNDRVQTLCDDEEGNNQKRYKSDRSPELYDAF